MQVPADTVCALISRDIHFLWANSAALRYFGFNPAKESGILKEQRCFESIKKLASLTEKLLDAWILDAARDAASKGVTEIVDLEMAHNIGTPKNRPFCICQTGVRAMEQENE